jgi:Na+/H+-dicarboxylate symporter
LRNPPAYVWALLALLAGIVSGGMMPLALAPVANATRTVLSFVVLVAPVLIIGALSPAVATLIRRGLAGRFAGAVLGWFMFSSVAGSLLGILVAALIFDLPLAPGGGAFAQAASMLRELGSGGPASFAVLAVPIAVSIGLIGVKVDRVYDALRRVERAIARLGMSIGYALAPLILALGIMIGVTFGARLGVSHYGTIVVYSAMLAVVWWLFYVFVLLRYVGGVRSLRRLLKDYYFPTALFAAGTCSSLATIPVNLANAKNYGVLDEVADFVIPIGTIVHKGASAMQYMAYGPLIAGYFFGLPIGWSHMLVVWPVVVLYSMAAPGVPGAMGLSLWTGVLYASLLGLHDPVRSTFVGTWVALTGGIPDMFRSSGNATADGFSAIIFSNNFDKYFRRGARRSPVAPGIPESPVMVPPV